MALAMTPALTKNTMKTSQENMNTTETGSTAFAAPANQAKNHNNIFPIPVIAFDKSGRVIAGREYLEAIVKTGKTAKVNVVYGLDSVEELMGKLAA
jgi:hypothetical protein